MASNLFIKEEIESENEVEVEESIVTEETEVYQPPVLVVEKGNFSLSSYESPLEPARDDWDWDHQNEVLKIAHVEGGSSMSPDYNDVNDSENGYEMREMRYIDDSKYSASSDMEEPYADYEDYQEPETLKTIHENDKASMSSGRISPYTYSFQDVYGPDVCPKYENPAKIQNISNFKSAVDSISFKILTDDNKCNKFPLFKETPELDSVKTSTDSGHWSPSSNRGSSRSPLSVPASPQHTPEHSAESDNDKKDQDPDFVVKRKKQTKKRVRNSCSVCGKGCQGRAGLKLHMFTHMDSNEYTCSHCTKSFKYEKNLRTHFFNYHKNVSCPVCQRTSSNVRTLFQHIKFHRIQQNQLKKEGFRKKSKTSNVSKISRVLGFLGKMEKSTDRNNQKSQESPTVSEEEIEKEKRRMQLEKAELEAERRRIEVEKKSIENERAKIEAEKKRIQAKKLKVEEEKLKILKQHGNLPEDEAEEEVLTRAKKDQKQQNYSCHLCSKVFKYSRELWEHMGTHPNQEFKCDKCLSDFRTKRALRQHQIHNSCLRIKHQRKSSKGNQIDKPESSVKLNAKNVEQPARSVGSKNKEKSKYSCHICKKEFAYESSVTTHIESWHVTKKCTMCAYTTYSSVSLYHHMRKHKKTNRIKKRLLTMMKKKSSKTADLTVIPAADSENLLHETIKVQKEQKTVLNKKQKYRAARKNLTAEEKSPIIEKTKDMPKWIRDVVHNKYKCLECDYSAKSIPLMESHLISHTDNRDFVCNICSKAFKFKASLQEHVINHNFLKQCEKCKVKFTVRRSYTDHMRLKHGIFFRNVKKKTE